MTINHFLLGHYEPNKLTHHQLIIGIIPQRCY